MEPTKQENFEVLDDLDKIAILFIRNKEFYRDLVEAGRIDDALSILEIESGISS